MLSKETFEVMYEGYTKYCRDVKGYHTCADSESIWLWEVWKEILIDKWEQKLKEAKHDGKPEGSKR